MADVIVIMILLANLLFMAYASVKRRKSERDFERRRQEMYSRWADVKENKSEK